MGLLKKTTTGTNTAVLSVEDLRQKYGFHFTDAQNAYFTNMISVAEKACANYLGMEALRQPITWEEIFEKGTIDFFILKTSLLRYISDGIIYFADVEYKMSIEERQKHISYVYQIVEKNPNITFHIIDDDQIHKADLLVHTSIYNNMNKLFLKNTERYGKKYGPKFYTVPDRETISAITRYFNDLTNNPICTNFTAAAAMAFFDTYGTMIQRMLSLDIQ